MISHEELIEQIKYDPITGIFLWVHIKGRKTLDPAGCIKTGPTEKQYRVIRINKVLYRASRLAWFYITKTWPQDEIDHRDGDSLNDKFLNLRDSTHKQNMQNRQVENPNMRGIRKHRNRWQASIQHELIGSFETKEEAIWAYRLEAIKRYGEYTYND